MLRMLYVKTGIDAFSMTKVVPAILLDRSIRFDIILKPCNLTRGMNSNDS